MLFRDQIDVNKKKFSLYFNMNTNNLNLSQQRVGLVFKRAKMAFRKLNLLLLNGLKNGLNDDHEFDYSPDMVFDEIFFLGNGFW